jgi:hypothetical protein
MFDQYTHRQKTNHQTPPWALLHSPASQIDGSDPSTSAKAEKPDGDDNVSLHSMFHPWSQMEGPDRELTGSD